VDIDYEPRSQLSNAGDRQLSVGSEYVGVINHRLSMPKTEMAVDGAGVSGRYGEGPWAERTPDGEPYLASRWPSSGRRRFALSIWSCDVVRPRHSYARRSVAGVSAATSRSNAMGIEVPPEAWGGGAVETPPAGK